MPASRGVVHVNEDLFVKECRVIYDETLSLL